LLLTGKRIAFASIPLLVVYFQGGEYECSLGNDSFQRILLALDSTYLKLKPDA